MTGEITCSFCAAKSKDVPLVIASPSPGVFICSNCVAECVQVIAGIRSEKAKTLPLPEQPA